MDRGTESDFSLITMEVWSSSASEEEDEEKSTFSGVEEVIEVVEKKQHNSNNNNNNSNDILCKEVTQGETVSDEPEDEYEQGRRGAKAKGKKKICDLDRPCLEERVR